MPPPSPTPPWWKAATIYQIYPSSFASTTRSGVGDIPGIIARLPHIHSLGCTAIWLSPHYASPQKDMGYDVSDYESIYPPYGTLQDCLDLIAAVHALGMKIIFDLVVNHTSSEHAWFKESRASKGSKKRDWYIWRPAKYGSDGTRRPPNNWRSNFSKPAWTWDEGSGEYYLHLFAPEQPDLNWENESCRKAIYDSAMRFWLSRGVDGFRVDTVNLYSKTPGLPDAPVTDPGAESQPAMQFYVNGPRLREYLAEMNGVLAEYGAMTVGELPDTPDFKQVVEYTSASSKWGMSMVFNFECITLGQWPGERFRGRAFTKGDFKRELLRWQAVVGATDAWTTVFLENHDQGRSVSRFGDDGPMWRERSAKMLALVLCSMSGTLFVYQGQEIGMINARPGEWVVGDYEDVKSRSYYEEVRRRCTGNEGELGEALESLRRLARDHARVPMQWDGSATAGFAAEGVRPWMKVLKSAKEINVKEQEGREGSVLEFWRGMIRLRGVEKGLFVFGVLKKEDEGQEELLMFEKEEVGGAKRSVTVANLSGGRIKWKVPGWVADGGAKMIVGNVDDEDRKENELQPWEGRVYISV